MASGTANTAYHSTLVASTVDTVTLNDGEEYVTLVNRSGSAEIYATVGTSAVPPATPTVGGNDTYVLPAAIGSLRVAGQIGPTVVKLISSGTPTYSVEVVAS